MKIQLQEECLTETLEFSIGDNWYATVILDFSRNFLQPTVTIVESSSELPEEDVENVLERLRQLSLQNSKMWVSYVKDWRDTVIEDAFERDLGNYLKYTYEVYKRMDEI